MWVRNGPLCFVMFNGTFLDHHVLILKSTGRVLDVVFSDLSVKKAKPPRLHTQRNV